MDEATKKKEGKHMKGREGDFTSMGEGELAGANPVRRFTEPSYRERRRKRKTSHYVFWPLDILL